MTHNPSHVSSDITVLVHTRNSARTLADTLTSVQWARERIVIDMQSTDGTVALAEAHQARVISIPPHDRVDEVRNAFLGEVQTEWTLVLDSDETLPDDAEGTIQTLLEDAGSGMDAFVIPRLNQIGGQWMKGCGWYPDPQLRLFRTGTVTWSEGHHQFPKPVSGTYERVRWLDQEHVLCLHHKNYRNLCEVIERNLKYALSDRYEENPETFDFRNSVAAAHQVFASRHEPDKDGDLATALATVMAWDQVIRGLIEWDRLGRVHPLKQAFSLPPSVEEPSGMSPEDRENLLKQLEEERALRIQAEQRLSSLESTRWVQGVQWLIRRFPRAVSLISRRTSGA